MFRQQLLQNVLVVGGSRPYTTAISTSSPNFRVRGFDNRPPFRPVALQSAGLPQPRSHTRNTHRHTRSVHTHTQHAAHGQRAWRSSTSTMKKSSSCAAAAMLKLIAVPTPICCGEGRVWPASSYSTLNNCLADPLWRQQGHMLQKSLATLQRASGGRRRSQTSPQRARADSTVQYMSNGPQTTLQMQLQLARITSDESCVAQSLKPAVLHRRIVNNHIHRQTWPQRTLMQQ
jgi:hypothetical protein